MEDDPHRVLARNAACHQCRRRKLKCDAARPTCGNCRKPRQRGPIKYEPPEPCTWDGVRGPSARTLRKREAKQRRAAQEAAAGASSASSQAQQQEWSMNNGGPSTHDAHLPDLADLPDLPDPNVPLPYTANGMPSNMQLPGAVPTYSMATGPSSGTMPGMDWGRVTIPPPIQAGAAFDSMATEGFSMNDMPDDPTLTSGALVHSSWPRDLPVPSVVRHIVQVFFERVPVLTKMFHRPSFMCKLQLPPTHPDFPTIVLHGILAATAPFISAEALASQYYFPTGSSKADVLHPERDFSTLSDAYQPSGMLSLNARLASSGTPLSRFQMWHRRKCVEGLSSSMSFGQGLLEAMYAISLVSYTDYMNGWFVDMWMESMTGVRLGVGLNMNNSSIHISNSLDRFTAHLLPPVKSSAEQAERDRLWWMAVLVEQICCSGMSMPMGIPDDEVTVELPVNQTLYEAGGEGLVGVQSLQSPDFYSHHPPQHMDTLPLMIKTYRLFTATNAFIRKYSRKEHTYQRYLNDPTLRQLLADINTFRMSWPPHMRNPLRISEDGSRMVDTELFLVIHFTHAGVINLGENVITHQTWTNDVGKMVLSAIRAVLAFIYEVKATSYDITLLPAPASMLWSLGARCLCRFINAARLAGDAVASGIFEEEYGAFEDAMVQLSLRHPIARRLVKRLQVFRMSWVKPDGPTVVTLAYDKDQVFDEEFENRQKSTAASTGSSSLQSPSTNTSELHNAGYKGASAVSSGVSVTSAHPTTQHATPEAVHSMHVQGTHSPLSAGAHSHVVSPHGLSDPTLHSGVVPPGGHIPLSSAHGHMGGGVQQQLPTAYAPPVQPPPQHKPPPPQQQQHQYQSTHPHQPPTLQPQPHQHQHQLPPHAPPVQMSPGGPLGQVRGPCNDPSTGGTAMPSLPIPSGHIVPPPPGPPSGVAPAPPQGAADQMEAPWVNGMDGFHIGTYSFDVDSMLAMLQSENPNATFGRTTMFSMSST